jgi:ribose transport system permease protein
MIIDRGPSVTDASGPSGSDVVGPGRFSPLGVFVATYFLVTGVTDLQLLGGAGWAQDVFYGGALVIAVTLAQLVARRRRA